MATVSKTAVVPTMPESEARLSEGAAFDGHWKGSDVFVQGRLEGELTLTGRLRVGRTGSVLGRVKADSVELGGEFTGEVQARLIVITESARARGTFVSERLIVKEGAVVDGAFDRPKTPLAPAGTASPAQPASPAAQRTPPAAPPAGPGAAPAPTAPTSGPDKPQAKPSPDDTVPPKQQA
jgi:cytoskeletal protein CcmA (bactofilin family)